LISLPDISEFEIDEKKDEFLIIASDGLWDAITDAVRLLIIFHLISQTRMQYFW